MKKEVKNKKSFFRRLIIAAAIISFLSVSFYTVYTIAQSALNKEVTHGKLRDENVILYFEDSQINKGFGLSDGNIVLTTNSLVSFKSDGSVRSSDKLGYSNPLVKSKSGNYIVFERSTGKFAIMNRMGVVYHSDGGDEIINADIAKNGNYAIITRKTQASSVLSVYSSSNKLLFQWECTDEYLSQAALSKNGKTVAVSSIGVKNGEAYSKIMFFNLDSTDVEGAFEYTGESAYVIRFIGNKELSVITDKSYMIADLRSMESQVISYDYDVVDGYAFADNNSAAILKKAFGTLDKYILILQSARQVIMFLSDDGANWNDHKLLFTAEEKSGLTYYSTIVGLDDEASDDFNTVGHKFGVYFTHKPEFYRLPDNYGNYAKDKFYRCCVTIE